MDDFILGWFCFHVHPSSSIHPSIHPSLMVCRWTVASLQQQLSFLFSCAVITQKHKFLESSTKNLQFVGGKKKAEKLAERGNNENPVVMCATKFNAG
jgi:hypothetical protein